jgi:hypothetical protein
MHLPTVSLSRAARPAELLGNFCGNSRCRKKREQAMAARHAYRAAFFYAAIHPPRNLGIERGLGGISVRA